LIDDGIDTYNKLTFIITQHEEILQMRRGVKPNNSPIQIFPNGKVRIPKLGTYTSVDEAYKALRRTSGDTSNETLPL
jgi:hypothetical protein